MKNNPFCASFLRRICDLKAPFIGVFLFITLLVAFGPVFAEDLSAPDTSMVSAIDTGTTSADPTLEQSAVPDENQISEDIEINPEEIINEKNTDETKIDEIKDEDTQPKVLQSSGDINRTQTFGKYIEPNVSTIDGSLSYAYPIVVPPGRNGLNPDIKLIYSTNNQSIGPYIGAGWSLNIPYIQRNNKKGTDKIYTEDFFSSSLDGELINKGNNIFVPRVENGNFLKYEYQNNAWVVIDKKGTQYKFGTTAGSRQDDPNNSSKIFTWMLESVKDTNGNTISYKYYKDQGQIYPDNISYNQSGKFLVEFNRDFCSGIGVSYSSAFRVVTACRITSIKTKVDGVVSLEYLISAPGGQVKTITVKGYKDGGAFQMPPVQFNYPTDDGQKKWSLESGFALPKDPVTGKVFTLDYNQIPSQSNNFTAFGNLYKDVNGDGLPDIIRWFAGKQDGYVSPDFRSGNQVFINTGSGFKLDQNFKLPTNSQGQVLMLDYTNGSPSSTSDYFGSKFIDINRDGLIDIIRWSAGRKNGEGDVTSGNQVFLNTGTNFVFEPSFTFPTDSFGKVFNLGYSDTNKFGNSFMDINGDNLPDIVRWMAGKQNGYFNPNLSGGNQVFINTGSGFVLDSNFKFPTDSLGQVLVLNYNNTSAYGNSFKDINGDRLVDIIRWTQGQSNGYASASPLNLYGNQVFINTGYGFKLDSNFKLPTDANGKVLTLDYKTGGMWGDNNYGNSFTDINGDGLIDVLRWKAGLPNGYSSLPFGNEIFLNTGTGFKVESSYLLPTNSSGKVYTLDYNQGPNGSTSGPYGNSFKDINGDGLVDIVRWAQGKSNGYVNSNLTNSNQIFFNTGSGFVLDSSFTFPTDGSGLVLSLDYNSTSVYGNSFIDVNGDGILDILRWWAGYPDGSNYSSNYASYGNQVFLNKVGRGEITKITNSAGGVDTYTFTGIRNFRNFQNYSVNSKIPEDNKNFVVISHTSNDNNGNSGTTNYKYSGADYYYNTSDIFDKKFTSFSEVIETKLDGSNITTKYHQNNGQNGNEPTDSYAKIGKVYEEIVQDAFGNLYSRIRNNYIENNLSGNANSIMLASILSQTFDGNSSHKDVAEEYAYDSYGNMVRKVSLGEVSGYDNGAYTDVGSDKFTENIIYAPSMGNYLVSYPSKDTVLDILGNKVRETIIYYDDLDVGVSIGNAVKVENWISAGDYAITEKTYNSLGMVLTSTNENSKITTYDYDAANLYPVKITNPLLQKTHYVYDYSTGQLRQVTDENNFIYQTTYDAFGRVLQERIPDFVSPYALVVKTEYTYNDTPLSVSVKKTDYLDNLNSVDTYQYFDGFNRLIQERKEGETAGTFNVRDLAYNNKGQLQKESLRYTSTGYTKTIPTSVSTLYNNYTYDILGRVTAITNSIGTNSTQYDDWKTTTTDANGKSKSYYKDAYSNLVKVEEKNGTNIYSTNYEWNGNKKLTKITDALLNVRSFIYDGLGRRLKAEDLHAPLDTTYGAWTYVYDDAGNVIKSTSPKGTVVNYVYDDLGRESKEYLTDPNDPEVYYLYDSTLRNGVGKIYSTFARGANTNYYYNSNGAVSKENKIIDLVTYTTSFSYDRQGNIANIIYPDNSEVKYTYNTAGLLEKIETKESGGTFANVVSNFDYSPMDQIATQASANGTTVMNTYDAGKLYRLTRKLSQNASGVKLQDLNYTYDNVGNILKLVDASNTDNAKTVNYTYDDLNRLLFATATNVASGRLPYTQTFSYDALGNILSGSAGAYVYSGVGYNNPHAVTKITSPNNYVQDFIYDKNGNLTGKTTTQLTAVLNASVVPNGLVTEAGFTGSGLNTVQPIGSGSSPVALGPVNLSNISPNTTYTYQVSGSNVSSGYNVGGPIDGENAMSFSTASGPAPEITAYSLGNIGKYSATIMAEINPNGRSTDAWFLFQGSQRQYTSLPDCNNLYNMPTYTLSNLSANTTYQVKVIAKNDKGTTDSGWISFTTLPEPPPPPPPPGIPPPPVYYHYPYVTSFSLSTNVPLYKLDDVSYSWNYNNQLSAVSNSTSQNDYVYDFAGGRVKATVEEINTGKTYSTYYPNKFYQITKVALSQDTKTRYIYAGNTLVATYKKVGTGATDVTYVYTDNLGGTSVTAKSDGSLRSALDYYPYGEERICAGDCNVEKKYIGQYYDVDTALNYLNARYYDGFRGQFVSQDPVFWEIGLTEDGNRTLLEPQLQNSYSYAGNNPIIKSDPSGRIIDTIADIGFIAYDLYDLTRAYLKGESVKEQLVYLSLDVGGAAVPFVTGVGMVARTAKVAKVAGEGAKIIKGAEKTNDIAKAGNIIINTAEHERQVAKYGKDGVKYLENGNVRYYGKIKDAKTSGEMAGRRMVREWDPITNLKRTWQEVIDHNDIVRQVRVGENPKIHYTFDQLGNFIGKW